MTPRRRAILILGLLLLLIGIIIVAVILLRRAVPPSTPIAPVAEEPTDVFEPPPADVDFVNPLVVEAEAVPGATASQQMAELFAERYGSYSNQGDYQNLRDLLPVMTASFRQTTEEFLETADGTPGQPFDGVSSEKVSTDVREADEDSAVIAVTLQQERTSGNAAPTIGYRALRMELLRVGEDWRVDAATWEN